MTTGKVEVVVIINDDISSYDVSNETSMRDRFKYAESFNQDIRVWTVNSGTTLTNMFNGATQFKSTYSLEDTPDYTDFNIQDSCNTLAVFGCTDSLSFNYDSLANVDNGGCIHIILGCMNSLAFNYDPLSNTHDTCVPLIYFFIDK